MMKEDGIKFRKLTPKESYITYGAELELNHDQVGDVDGLQVGEIEIPNQGWHPCLIDLQLNEPMWFFVSQENLKALQFYASSDGWQPLPMAAYTLVTSR